MYTTACIVSLKDTFVKKRSKSLTYLHQKYKNMMSLCVCFTRYGSKGPDCLGIISRIFEGKMLTASHSMTYIHFSFEIMLDVTKSFNHVSQNPDSIF